jgi:hypothetical protein
VCAMRISKELGPFLFFLWLLLVNIFYYIRFRTCLLHVCPGWPGYGIDCFGEVYCLGLTRVMGHSVVNAAAHTML